MRMVAETRSPLGEKQPPYKTHPKERKKQKGGGKMSKEEIKRQLQELPKEDLKALLKELIGRQPRQKKEIPEDVKKLVEEYQELKNKLQEIREQLKQKGYTPTGLTIRRGYGDYDYRNSPAYNVVKEILSRQKYTTVEQLEEELKKHGYKGITGTIGVVLKNLKDDGLIKREGGVFEWLGE